MSNAANWSYTATATLWRSNGTDEYNQRSFYDPTLIKCDYLIGGTVKSIGGLVSSIGKSLIIKATFFTEYDQANIGDFILVGSHQNTDPVQAGADEILHITQWADTFERSKDDFALITGA